MAAHAHNGAWQFEKGKKHPKGGRSKKDHKDGDVEEQPPAIKKQRKGGDGDDRHPGADSGGGRSA